MKHLLLLCLLASVTGCVAAYPSGRPYTDRDHDRNDYDRSRDYDHDRRDWDNHRDNDNDDHHRDHDDNRRDYDNR